MKHNYFMSITNKKLTNIQQLEEDRWEELVKYNFITPLTVSPWMCTPTDTAVC